MSDVKTELLQGITALVDRSHISGLCANCMAPLSGEMLHVCNPEQQANLMMQSVWRELLEGQTPMQRAISYGVK